MGFMRCREGIENQTDKKRKNEMDPGLKLMSLKPKV